MYGMSSKLLLPLPPKGLWTIYHYVYFSFSLLFFPPPLVIVSVFQCQGFVSVQYYVLIMTLYILHTNESISIKRREKNIFSYCILLNMILSGSIYFAACCMILSLLPVAFQCSLKLSF